MACSFFWLIVMAQVQIPDIRPIGNHTSIISSVCLSPSADLLVTAEGRKPEIKFWSVKSGKLLLSIDTKGQVWDIAFSPCGNRVGVALGPLGFVLVDWKKPTKTEFFRTPGHVARIAFSPDGNLLATPINNIVAIWDLKGENHKTFVGHKETVEPIFFNFSYKGKDIVSASSEDGIIRIWDYFWEEDKGFLKAHDYGLMSVTLVKESLIVSGGFDGYIVLSDLRKR